MRRSFATCLSSCLAAAGACCAVPTEEVRALLRERGTERAAATAEAAAGRPAPAPNLGSASLRPLTSLVPGKSTLLQVFGGKTMVDKDAVRVLGLPPFHTTSLTCDGTLSYLGSQWRRSVACVGSVEVGGDIPAGDSASTFSHAPARTEPRRASQQPLTPVPRPQ